VVRVQGVQTRDQSSEIAAQDRQKMAPLIPDP